MVTADNLYQILMALKDAGVSRAKIGDAEFEFERPVVEYDKQPAALSVISAPTPGPVTVVGEAETKHPGYSSLFGDRAPRFAPADK